MADAVRPCSKLSGRQIPLVSSRTGVGPSTKVRPVTSTLLQSPLSAALERVAELDFRHLKQRLCAGVGGAPGWPRHVINEVEVEYRRFLALVATYPEAELAPSPVIDMFWHQHILDTRRYGADCERALGFFLHHIPTAPGDMESEPGADIALERTRDLYRHEFPAGNLAYWYAISVQASASDPKTTVPVPSECYGTPEPHGG